MRKKLDPHLPFHDGSGSKKLSRLYAMAEDEAIEETLSWIEEDHPPQARLPIDRWTAAQGLKKWHERYKDGDRGAILESLYLCTLNDLPIPSWVTLAYLKAFRDVYHYRAKSWDDVFGQPHAKGTHLEAKKEEWEKSLRVYQRIKKIKQKNPDTPIDGHLFETVGKEFGTGGKTKTEQWYYKWKNKLKI